MARIERSIEVDVPVRVAYNQWTQFEEFPRFMEGVKEVRQVDDTHLHWRAEIGGKEKEWDAEITEQIPDHTIAWRSVSGTSNGGKVSFRPRGPNRTLVELVMEYDAEGFLENVGDILGVTTRRVEGDLQRFKNFIESRGRETGAWRGEVHGGQPTQRGVGTTEEYTGSTGTAPSGTAFASRETAERQAAGTTLGSHDPSYWSGERDRRRAERRRAMQPQSAGELARSSSGTPARRQEFLPSRWLSPGARWDEPFTALRRMAEEMDDMFDRVLGRMPTAAARRETGMLWTPHIDVAQKGDQLVIRADLPGIRKEDVNIDISEDMLTLEGERRQESEQTEHGFHRVERTYGRFYRSIPLPDGADINSARASMRDGVLEISMKAPQRSGRRLEIGEEQPTPHRRTA